MLGNASGINDGAACVLLMSEEGKDQDLNPLQPSRVMDYVEFLLN